tara:strand:+ start:463 stop:651 length:189 start_codon:yes stop_codon:yes gene_type:complete
MKLSDQAMGAIMGALQKCILEQSDIVPMLKDFNFNTTEDDVLVVTNPPAFSMKVDDDNVESN